MADKGSQADGDMVTRMLFRKQIAVEMAKNLAMQFSFVRALRTSMAPRTSAAGARIDSDDLQRYAIKLPRLLMSVVGKLDGKHIAEIGPGDHLATGLAMLAAGAASYTCLDRFTGSYDNAYAKGWYRAVHAAWPTLFPDIPWPEWLKPESFPEAYADRVKVVRAGVEGDGPMPNGSCDVVCSHAVGEHVLDVQAFGRSTHDLLAAGGTAVHLVDFSQHFEWARYGDRYLFLSLSDRTWDWIGSARGSENRVRYHEFVDALERGGLSVQTVNRKLADKSPDLQRLLPRFRVMPADSLLTLEATFICSRR